MHTAEYLALMLNCFKNRLNFYYNMQFDKLAISGDADYLMLTDREYQIVSLELDLILSIIFSYNCTAVSMGWGQS